ncbi:F0F1 ATP synthase subunit B family protein [Acidomonas methanolica]|uniref:ATP synthase subunit b n=1 Tax=Acidomonas methanolica NBRC 104435 TaxID=1231351 RepID=A0A023D7T0_ACIMT|nr:ATP synthase F0 subunit B [Acidomonas methanolica]MBU2655311.1 ATP synthase F0 subunit B [Acidomonas methanolica]TCS23806.1 F-type H+-transporting ATPase subunit b [Acidomonas methanolica]GAJ29851.1 ATP synthase F0 subunit beta' [Acidomonas methanolica NBRC 104435]GBQ53165.1 ATP synthase F0 subunit beta' [Acidomonas methanolica]GEL00200.1 hypothetical protein AME01nite_26980 [Acidomonas methanolica NBRC 104435]
MLHDQRFYVAIAFVIFFILFGRKLWTAIVTQLDAHAQSARQELAEAAELRRQAEQILEDATREREQALAEAQAMIEHSRQEAALIGETARRDAEAIATRREQMARDRIAASERAAVQDVRKQAIEAAAAAVREVVAHHLAENGEAASTLVDRSLDALPGALRAANEAGPGAINAA